MPLLHLNALQIFALLVLLSWVAGAPSFSSSDTQHTYAQLSPQLNPHYLHALAAYRRLERRVPYEELRALITIGLLNGARQAEQQMEQHLVSAIKELLLQTDLQDEALVLPKIDEIEQQLMRDQRALDILSSVMDMVTRAKDEHTFRFEMRMALQQHRAEELQEQQLSANVTQAPQLGERLATLRQRILRQVPKMKTQLEAKIENTLDHLVVGAALNGLLAKASNMVLINRSATQETQTTTHEHADIRMIKSILTEDDFRENLVMPQLERRNRSAAEKQEDLKDQHDEQVEGDNKSALDIDLGNVTVSGSAGNATTAKQEEDSAEISPPDMETNGGGGGGGLVGIIGSLSGGEGGSDVGALIGALTGVISTIFGPGGLDIESLIGSATSLLAGLLSGNKNFGTVLGIYVGTAFDGLSGGGGAINNGQFLGNFLGTVLASLSADPEEESGPQPLLFTKNLLSSFLEAKNRPSSAEASEERHGTAELLPRQKKKKEASGATGSGGFDSGSFVKQIASHLVSSALGLILNASLGASGGASGASSGLFSSSSSASNHMKPAAAHHRTWSDE